MALSIGDSVLQMVLAQANKEQNQHYPPSVYQEHFRLASHWLKNKLVSMYPTSQLIIDLLLPGMRFQKIPVQHGRFDISTLFNAKKEPIYRNLLGVGFYVTDLDCCEPARFSDFADPEHPTDDELKQLDAMMEADFKDIAMISVAEWGYYTSHPYKKPKVWSKAKGCFFDYNTARILPINIPFVEVRFLMTSDPFVYGYQMNPDDTYYFDPTTTTEDIFSEVAIPYLFEAINIFCANYLRDTEYIASAKDLRENSIFES